MNKKFEHIRFDSSVPLLFSKVSEVSPYGIPRKWEVKNKDLLDALIGMLKDNGTIHIEENFSACEGCTDSALEDFFLKNKVKCVQHSRQGSEIAF